MTRMVWNKWSVVAALGLLGLGVGCSDDGTPSDTGSSETRGDGDGDTGDGDGDSGGVMCPEQFPEFDKSCAGAEDCAAVEHTVDCCGNAEVWGINAAEVAAFEAAEAVCDAQYPQCDCPAGPPIADDGNPVLDPQALALECVAGSCTTSVP